TLLFECLIHFFDKLGFAISWIARFFPLGIFRVVSLFSYQGAFITKSCFDNLRRHIIAAGKELLYHTRYVMSTSFLFFIIVPFFEGREL
ncbi:MAG TPA: hypothetical protein VIL89_05795, partial [Clostridia bacterium]